MEKEIKSEHPAVDEQLRRRAEAIALFMGGDYNMTASVGPWGSGWGWDFANNHVNMDAKDLATEPEDIIKGIAAHEGNHRLISRPEHAQDLWQEPGFSFGLNAVEDPRANEGGMNFRPGSRDWVRAYIERDLGPGGGLDYKNIKKDATNALGYVPKYMQWGGEMIRYWYEREFADKMGKKEEIDRFLKEIPDKDVREAVRKTLPAFDAYYKAIPSVKDENEVQVKAKESTKNFKERMWPIYKDLVEKSYDDQSLVEMLQDMISQDGKQGQGQGGQMIVMPFSSLPQEVQDEIRKKIQEAEEQKQKGEGAKAEQKSSRSGQNKDGQGEKQKAQEEGEGLGDDSQGEKKAKEGKKEGKKEGQKIPWDKLSDKAKEATKNAFEQLPKSKQDEYEDKAKESLETQEDAANEKLRGKMNDPRHTKTHKEQKEEGAQKQENSQDDARTQQVLKDMDRRRQEALKDLGENPYHVYLKMQEVDRIRRRQEREFKKIFEPTEEQDIRFSSSGLKPSMNKARQAESDPRITNIFETKKRPTEKKYRFTLLVDLSPSMSGEKIVETFKLLVAFVETMNRFGLEYAVIGFRDGFENAIKVYKDYDVKKLTRKDRDKMGEMLEDIRHGSSTPTHEATTAAYKMVKEQDQRRSMRHNYLITLTDGAPSDISEEELLKLVGF